METKEKCCICGREIEGFSNNAWPMAEGRCCSDCDRRYVIRARLILRQFFADAKKLAKTGKSDYSPIVWEGLSHQDVISVQEGEDHAENR